MKKTKTCPKCQGTEIYTNDGLLKRGDRSSIIISAWSSFSIAVYVCAKCGFFEEYADEISFNREKVRTALEKEWKLIDN